MSHKEAKSGHNVRFEPRTLDERMEDIFDHSDKLSLPNVGEESNQPDPNAHHFDENDYQLHRKESYPLMHNLLKPMYVRPKHRHKSPPTASEIPEHGETSEPAKSPDDDKVQFYVEDGRQHPDDPEKIMSSGSIPTSPSSCSVEALAFQSQSPDEPIPSAINRHRLDELSPSDGPEPSQRASKKSSDNKLVKDTSPRSIEDEAQKFFKKKPHRRRASKQEDPIWRQRIGSELDFNQHVPMIDEDESAMLASCVVDNITSHRLDEMHGVRRYKLPLKSTSFYGKDNDKVDGNVLLQKKVIDHKPHEVFVQMNELHYEGYELEWTERARFIKYEEDVEEGTDRWGKPHVASLSFHSLLNLRECLESSALLLDLEESELSSIYQRVVEAMFIKDRIRQSDRVPLLNILMLRHTHMNDKKMEFRIGNYTYHNLQLVPSKGEAHTNSYHNDVEAGMNSRKSELNFVASSDDVRKHDNSILRRIPEGAEAIAVNIGAVDFLEQPAVAFVRLSSGQYIPSVTEVPIPVRFFFILIGPKFKLDMDYHEVGRSISALMKDVSFHEIAYRASERKELLSGINEFLDGSIVLPPGDWTKQSLLPVHEIQKKNQEIQRRRSVASNLSEVKEMKTLVPGKDGDDPLRRTKKLFGGLVTEMKTRYRQYASDIKDAFNTQTLASAIFMYFAALSGAVTFGGLYGDKTYNQIGVTETLMINSVCGIMYALLCGQPTTIIAATGPVLLFDEILFTMCSQFQIEFLSIRVWIGIWMAVIGILVVMFEGSALVKFFTRFTQEIFSALISLMYTYEAFHKLYLVFQTHPLKSDYCFVPSTPIISSQPMNYSANNFTDDFDMENDTSDASNDMMSSVVSTILSTTAPFTDGFKKNQPNTALISTIMMLGTFFIAYYLRHFRNSKFLGRSARRTLGDFGVPIAIISMVVLDILLKDTYTMKLNVPEGLTTSNSTVRGWFISPMGVNQPLPIWQIFMAALPALLLFILFFMEIEITQLIMSKKLKKGTGFHLDMLLLCLTCIVSGFIGGPWLSAATVRSLTHVSGLTVMSRTHAPGETPKVIDIKDQRLSTLFVYIFLGLSVLMAPVLRQIPVAVLFGIFLYMGISSMSGIQFLDRIVLFFMPVKHHPDVNYVRKVRTYKMHLFTFIQVSCLVVLWAVKSSPAALAFPFILVMLVPLRRQLSCIFTPFELTALDCNEVEPAAEQEEPDFYEASVMAG